MPLSCLIAPGRTRSFADALVALFDRRPGDHPADLRPTGGFGKPELSGHG